MNYRLGSNSITILTKLIIWMKLVNPVSSFIIPFTMLCKSCTTSYYEEDRGKYGGIV